MYKEDFKVWDRTWQSLNQIKFDLNTRAIFRRISKEVPFKGKKVLELGCGSGRLSYLAYRAGAEDLTLVDFSEEALNIARTLFKGNDRVNFIKADILDLNVSDRYDIVFSSGVVEHFKDRDLLKAIEAHARLSRDRVAIVVPANTWFNRRRSRLRQNIKKYGYWKPIAAKEMSGFFEKASIRMLSNKRFYTMYGVPLPNISGASALRLFLAFISKPLDKFYGGLLLSIGKVKKRI